MLTALPIALRAIQNNRLRSALTMLGVMIGIAAVIALQAIGQGQKTAQLKIYDQMGANRIMVFPGFNRRGGTPGVLPKLDLDDARAFMELPAVHLVSPESSTRARLKYRANTLQTQVVGALPEYFEVENFSLRHGRVLTASDEMGWGRVVVLGSATAENLFGTRDPTGEQIKVNGREFTVIGVLEEKGAMPWMNPDENVVVPLTTLWNKLGGTKDSVDQMVVQAASSDAAKELEDQLTAILKQRHPQFARNDDLFQVFNMAEMQKQREESSQVISTFLLVVGAIALFIGGIGIMNIMLVTVSERTREIGLRKAIGATPLAIMGQFLTEAVVLCVMAGLLGVGMGVGIATLMARASETLGFPAPEVHQGAVIIAVSVALGIGIAFGTMPAMKAAQMDPIRALRHE